ncbi:MAG TPA: hypothetical protein PKE51_00505, partial [Gemmatimonadaceae bacterium]|nr:hypothetical protein [Gemmatimonadaceae bacterium]
RHSMDLAVQEDKLSQAIGRGGQNVRLASELTGWELNVMTEAAAELAFERAAAWRDKRERLAWLWSRVTRFQASMDRLTFRYDVPPSHADDPGRVYLVRRGTVRAELPMPHTPADHRALETLAQQIFGASEPSGDDVPRHDLDEFYLVASWFRRRPQERQRTRAMSLASDGAVLPHV